MISIAQRILDRLFPRRLTRRGHAPTTAHSIDAAQLEDRVLFSAAPLPTGPLLDAGADQLFTATTLDTQTAEQSSSPDVVTQQTTAAFADGRRELVFVDTSAASYQQLVDDLLDSEDANRQFEVFLLDSSQDGIEQISEILADYNDLDAIHLVSHGTDGRVNLGNVWLDIDNLSGYAGEIAGWNDAVRDGGDLLIYGCNLAANEDGQALTQAISTLCDCDVAASDDDTGHAALGGDWELEYASGVIDVGVAFSADLQQSWMGLLANLTFQDGAGGYTGTQDTYLDSGNPTLDFGTAVTVTTDDSGPFFDGLIRFDNIFGDGPGQIPIGSIITSATLTVEVTNASHPAANITLHRMLANWDELSTWNSMTGGIQADNVEAATTADSTIASPNATGSQTFSGAGVTATVQAWADGNENNGWAILNDRNNDWIFSSSNDPTIAVRPSLDVTYTPPPVIIVDQTLDQVDAPVLTVAGLATDKGADGMISLREAIRATNNTAGYEVISLTAGTFTLSLGPAGDDAAVSGDLDILGDVRIYGAGAGVSIIDGGAMDRVFQIQGTGIADISGVTIQNGGNVAQGGGIQVLAGGELTLSNSIVQNNTVAINAGAGIDNSGTLTLTDVQITGNIGSTNGGGLNNNAAATFERVTIDNNDANRGAGIYNAGPSPALNLTNVTISNNTAVNDGGAIFTTDIPVIVNSTIAFNSAGAGADGIHTQGAGGNADLQNTILHNPAGINTNRIGGLISSGFNIDSDNTALLGDIVANPNLDPTLQNNGGFTPTHALTVSSTDAIDGGANSGTPALDQRGYARVGNTDIGAYEYNGFNPANDPPINSVPAAQATPQDTQLVFNTGNGNLVSISDVDAGGANVEVTLNVTNGDVTLNIPAAVATPAGGEVLVNTTLGQTQAEAVVAMRDTGDYVVAWSGKGGGGESDGVWIQLYDPSGTADPGGNIRVNTETTDVQSDPTIAMADDGSFVVVWTSVAQDGQDTGVFGQRFDSAGNTIGLEFQINTNWNKNQQFASVAMDADGDFVVVWEEDNQLDGQNEGIFGQRFNSLGIAQGSEFQVNANWVGKQTQPKVAMDAAGNFVVVWTDSWLDGHQEGVFAQRFDKDGNTLGGEFQVNSEWDKNQIAGDIAMNAAGEFVIVWTSYQQDSGSTGGIYGQRYDAAGNTVGGEFLINSMVAEDQLNPTVAMSASGGFVVTWESVNQDNPGDFLKGVYLQQFDADGSPLGGETLVNTTITGFQVAPDVAMNGAGDFVIAWDGNGAGDDQGVFHQRYQQPPPPFTFSSGDGFTDSFMRFQGTIADINAALDGLVFTPDPGFNGLATIDITTDDLGNTGTGGAKQDMDTVNINAGTVATYSLWLTTRNDVSGGGSPGIDTWSAGEIVQFGDPNLSFGFDNTNGTFSSVINFDALDVSVDGSVDIDAIHHVTTAMTVGGGGNTFDLQVGDLLLSTLGGETLDAANQLVVTGDDVFVYRQSNNMLYMLLDNLEGGAGEVQAVTFVEANTNIGTSTASVTAGNFLITFAATPNQIHEFVVTGVGAGAATSGTANLLMDGGQILIVPADDIQGIDLIETTLNMGGTTLLSGDILLTTGQTASNIGTPPITADDMDIFNLRLTDAGPTTTDGQAFHFFDGDDVNLNINAEDPHGITLTTLGTSGNNPPTADDDAVSVNEDDPSTDITATLLAGDTDPELNTLTITAVDTTGTVGTVTLVAGVVSYDPNGQFESLAVGETATDTFTYTIDDGNGNTDTATVTVTINGANDDPTADNDGVGVNEDDGATNITATLLAGDTDPDTTDVLAITAIDTTGTVGTVTLVAGVVSYDPNGQFESLAAGETTTDTFTYTIDDGNTGTDTATVTVTITGQNDDPTADNDAVGVNEDDGATNITATLLAGDTDPDTTDGLAITAIDTTGTVGTVTLVAGVVSYDPNGQFESLAAGETTTDTFTYTIDDGNTGTDTATVTVTITGQNDDPTADNDAVGVNEDDGATNITATLLAGDTDPDTTDVLAITAIDTTGTVGTVTLVAGVVSYDPNGQFESLAAGETTTDTFTYTIDDGNGGTDTATVTVTINGQNDDPVAVDDGGAPFTTDKDTAFTTGDALANDSDPDASDVSLVTGIDVTGTLGLVVDNGDGTFDYDPNGQFAGLGPSATATDTFTYTIDDGNGGTATATVTITITGVNTPPTAVDDSGVGFTGDEDTVFTTGDVLVNDNDPDPQTLSVSGIDTTGTLGTVVDNGNGTFDYDPAGQFENLAVGETATDTFVYTVTDGFTGTDTATVTITITGVNDDPTADDDGASVNEDDAATNITAALLAGDSDPDTSDTLAISAVDTTGTVGTVTLVTGVVSYDPNGQFEYLAVGETATDTFSYTVDDGNTGTDTATVTITINGANDDPTADYDATAIGEDAGATNITAALLTGDTDPDTNDTLTVTAVDTTGTVGTVTLVAGVVSYDPNGQFESLAVGETATDTFSYTIDDGNGGTDTATVTVTVNGANDGPTADNDAAVIGEDAGAANMTATLLAGDTDPDTTDTLAVAAVDTTGTLGTVTLVAGVVSYDPNGQFEGLAAGETTTDTFTYTVDDGNGGTETATATITISGANDDPTAVNDVGSTNEDTVLNVAATGVLNNDTDVDTSDVHTVTEVNGSAANVGAPLLLASGATITLNANGSYDYDPNGAFEYLAISETTTDTFTYKTTDGNGGSDTATVTITIDGRNDLPNALDDGGAGFTTFQDTAFTTTSALANDSDPDASDTLTVTGINTTGTLGSVVDNGDGTFDYTPLAGYSGLDSFRYTIDDGNGGTASATVNIDIGNVNDPPTAADDSGGGFNTDEDTAFVTGNVLANDTDPDTGDVLSVLSINTTGTQGTVTDNGNGTFTYDPNGAFDYLPAGATATDTFVYTVRDLAAATDTATVTIRIDGRNDTPVVKDDAFKVNTNTTLNVGATSGVQNNDADAENDPLSTTVVSGPANGTVALSTDGSFTYTPNTGFVGTDSFTYKANDGTIDSADATVTIKVTLPAPPPTVDTNPDPEPEPEPDPVPDPIPTPVDPPTDDPEPPPNITPPPDRPPDTRTDDGPPRIVGVDETEEEETELSNLLRDFGRPDIKDPRYLTPPAQLLKTFTGFNEGINLLGAYEFFEQLDSLDELLRSEVAMANVTAGTAGVVSLGLSAGYAFITIRAGTLVTSLLTSMPAWRVVDPLPVLAYLDEEEDDDDFAHSEKNETLESIVENAANAAVED